MKMLALKAFKKLSSSVKNLSSSTRAYKEIRIPVPWGHIAGKWWGPQNKRPVLGLHGWQDNCGTFDALAPELISDNGFLAVDFPGHGLSSKLPPGVFYHNIDYVITIRRIVEYFKWPQVSLLGHSMGGIKAYLYSVLYPDNVDFLICLDAFKPLAYDGISHLEEMAMSIDYFIKYDNLNTEPPSYSFHELQHSVCKSVNNSMSLEASKCILQRNVAASTGVPGKFFLTRDARLKAFYLPLFHQEFVTESAYKLKCPMFLSRSSHRSHPHESKMDAEDVLEIIRRTSRHFEYHYVEGTHHVHLNHPERLSGLINAFIGKYDVEDRAFSGLE